MRVVLAATGADTLADAVARALRDAGDEVVLLAPGASEGVLAGAALQEDADALVMLAPGPPDELVDDLGALLARHDADDVAHAVLPPEPATVLAWLRSLG